MACVNAENVCTLCGLGLQATSNLSIIHGENCIDLISDVVCEKCGLIITKFDQNYHAIECPGEEEHYLSLAQTRTNESSASKNRRPENKELSARKQ